MVTAASAAAWALLAAGAAGAAAAGGMAASAFGRGVTEAEVRLRRLPAAFDGMTILFITDIHRRKLPASLFAPLRERAGLVLVGGDLTERGVPLDRVRSNMELLASVAPVYAVHGNHDYRADTEQLDRAVKESGARLLADENTPLRRGGETLWLTGIDFPRRGSRAYGPLPALPPEEGQACRIVLVHDPLWLSMQERVPAELVLCGHTHGGQIRLPVLGARHADPFYRRYESGWHTWRGRSEAEPAQVLISRGFGTAHVPLRLRCPAEFHLLTLRRS